MELNINEKNIVLKFGPVTNPTTLSYYPVKPKKPVEGETGRRLKGRLDNLKLHCLPFRSAT